MIQQGLLRVVAAELLVAQLAFGGVLHPLVSDQVLFVNESGFAKTTHPVVRVIHRVIVGLERSEEKVLTLAALEHVLGVALMLVQALDHRENTLAFRAGEFFFSAANGRRGEGKQLAKGVNAASIFFVFRRRRRAIWSWFFNFHRIELSRDVSHVNTSV